MRTSLLLLLCFLAACSTPAPAVRTSTVEPIATTIATPAPSPTASPTPVTVASPSPMATGTETPSPEPATAAPSAVPLPQGPVHNEGQWIVVWEPGGIGFHIGEAPVAGTIVNNYTLNGTALTDATLRCAVMGAGEMCTDLRILPSTPLVFGQRYELALQGDVLGSFTAVGPASLPTPHVLSVEATQYEVTVTFDRPMLHVYDCGAQGGNLGAVHTIQFVRVFGSGFPFQPGGYTSSDPAYEAWFANFVSEAPTSDDCRSVTLRSGWGAPTGTFDLTVSDIADNYGTLVAPRTFEVTIGNEAPPKLMSAQLELQTAEKKVIRVMYSEAMDEEYVTDAERYLLNGKPIPANTALECEMPGCTWVRLTFAPTTFVYGAPNTLTIVGVRDYAGNTMTPDIVTSGTFEVR